MSLSYIDDANHWHIRASETRILAEPMTDAMSKEAMLGVAAGYDRMAKRAEEHMTKPSALVEIRLGKKSLDGCAGSEKNS